MVLVISLKPRVYMNKLGHKPALDGLRGLAIILVLIFHTGTFLSGGYLGVDLFFALSGFLITKLLLEEHDRTGRIDLKAFYGRRFLRLMPVYFVALLAVAVFVMTVLPVNLQSVHLVRVGLAALYQSNTSYVFGITSGWEYLGHTWSLSQEEQFYFVWPFALIILLRFKVRPQRVVIGLCSLTGLVILWRIYLTFQGAHFMRLYKGIDTHLDPMLLGCAAALVYHFGWVRFGKWLNTAGVVSYIALVSMCLFTRDDQAFTFYIVLPVAALSCCVLILWSLHSSDVSRLLSVRPLRLCGRFSYSLYLWHWFIYKAMFGLVPGASTGRLVLSVALSFMTAFASYYFIEKPFLSHKKRLTPPLTLNVKPALTAA